MPDYKVSIVSYLNSKVFLKGLQKFPVDNMLYSMDIPSVCADKLISGKVDIGLIPVAVIPLISDAEIISDFCISAEGKVGSVFLMSNDPLDQIHTIYLDQHSRTSNMLCRILAKEHWGILPDFKPRNTDVPQLNQGEAMVLIGDRTFPLLNNYKYIFDLAEHWEIHTQLPFVFAAWVSNKKIDQTFIEDFNQSLKKGLGFLDEVIEENYSDTVDVKDYLTNKIKYQLTPEKREAIQLFLSKVREQYDLI